MTKRNVLIVARLFFGLLTLAAIGTQLGLFLRAGLSTTNYFSHFTNLSNLLAAGVLLSGAHALLKHREPTALEEILRGISVVCMVLVGCIYGVLFRLSLVHDFLWAITCYLMPVVGVLDWFSQPPSASPAMRQLVNWLIFPLLYLGYVIFRGALVGSYAYPFVNPAEVGGYGGVALYSLALIALFFVVSWLLLTLRNKAKQTSAYVE